MYSVHPSLSRTSAHPLAFCMYKNNQWPPSPRLQLLPVSRLTPNHYLAFQIYAIILPPSVFLLCRMLGATHEGVCVKELGVIGNEDTSKHVVYISLRHRRGEDGVSKRLERIEIPGNLTTTTPTPSPERGHGTKGAEKNHQEASKIVSKTTTRDFDDAFFAEQRRLAYRHLGGSWFTLTLSARRLGHIQLAPVDCWSGGATSSSRSRASERNRGTSTASSTGLLMALQVRGSGDKNGDTMMFDIDASNPFTEAKLWDLWRHLQQGKVRYAWVHWARRIAAVNSGILDLESEKYGAGDAARRTVSSFPTSCPSTKTSILTIQLTHTFSILRLLVALALMLVFTVAAALLWIFLGTSGWRGLQAGGKGERVGPGMLIAVAALMVQMVGFAAWVGVSWWVVP